jgi:hypothetical protein
MKVKPSEKLNCPANLSGYAYRAGGRTVCSLFSQFVLVVANCFGLILFAFHLFFLSVIS